MLEWRVDKLKELDRQTRKLLIMYKGLRPKSDVDRLYVSRKEGGRGLMSCESTIRTEENNFGWYLNNSNENLLEEVKYVGILKFKESVSKKEKQAYGQFVRDMPEDTDKEKFWLWMRKCDLKIPTEALICSAKEQVIRTS